jgi:hypothetical protein
MAMIRSLCLLRYEVGWGWDRVRTGERKKDSIALLESGVHLGWQKRYYELMEYELPINGLKPRPNSPPRCKQMVHGHELARVTQFSFF